METGANRSTEIHRRKQKIPISPKVNLIYFHVKCERCSYCCSYLTEFNRNTPDVVEISGPLTIPPKKYTIVSLFFFSYSTDKARLCWNVFSLDFFKSWNVFVCQLFYIYFNIFFFFRYASELQESLNASAYRNGMPRRAPPALAQITARSDRQTSREGNGSLSRAQLYKRENMQNVLLRKSLNEK